MHVYFKCSKTRFVCSWHVTLHYVRQIVTNTEFVFITVLLHLWPKKVLADILSYIRLPDYFELPQDLSSHIFSHFQNPNPVIMADHHGIPHQKSKPAVCTMI